MDDQNKNLILATALSFAVILVWFVLFPPPEPPAESLDGPLVASQPAAGTEASTSVAPATAGGDTSGSGEPAPASEASDAPRIDIETARLSGSISLLGGRIDDLKLSDYRQTLDPGADTVTLLSPVGNAGAYYALYGWAPGAGLAATDVPGADTEWDIASGTTLSETTPVTLQWDNGAGLTFRRQISVDENYMFSVTQTVENGSDAPVSLAPYGLLARHGEPEDLKKFFILHEGVVGMADGELTEVDYSDMPDFAVDPQWGGPTDITEVKESGWIGFTDHYWMATLIPQAGAFKSVAKYNPNSDIYQTTAFLPTQTVAPGQSATVSTRLFAGAKEWDTIRSYQNDNNVQGFVDSIDWGWFFFLTKPIFAVLHWLNSVIGNMGWSIIGLTLLIKAVLFPLAFKSYVSMAKMKELQPQMEKLKKDAGEDKKKLQQAMMELYKKEKVNPASGCLPILMQIPIFFSLYKVIFVTLELRHAPWIGWINDLSAPDPSSILNLFGLLSFVPPEPGSVLAVISLGVLPIILGISMWLQQKLNPSPTDPTQAMIFAWMPWVFMFMLGTFASGLVVYWIANNTITFTQQYLIMRSQGYKPDVFGNIMKGFRKKPKSDAK